MFVPERDPRLGRVEPEEPRRKAPEWEPWARFLLGDRTLGDARSWTLRMIVGHADLFMDQCHL